MKSALIVRVAATFILIETVLAVLLYINDLSIVRAFLIVAMSGIFLVCVAGFLYAWFDR